MQKFPAFNYTDHVLELADQTAARVGPFVMLQWRQEVVPVTDISACAQPMAIEAVRQMRDRNITTVFIASDVPLHRSHPRTSASQSRPADSAANSASFRPKPENWAAIGTLVDVIRDWIPKAEILTWDEIRPHQLVTEAAAGSFVKLMGARAEHFISAGVGAGFGEGDIAGCAVTRSLCSS